MKNKDTFFSVDIKSRDGGGVTHSECVGPVVSLQRMYKGIVNSTPWLILAGSGGVADILVTLLNKGSWDVDGVQELLFDTFPNAHHSSDITNWVKLVRAAVDTACDFHNEPRLWHKKKETRSKNRIHGLHLYSSIIQSALRYCLAFTRSHTDGGVDHAR